MEEEPIANEKLMYNATTREENELLNKQLKASL
jgi:hypothetical protein